MKRIVAFLTAIIVVVSLSACGGEKGVEIVWEDMILGDKLPTPTATKGEIHTNSAKELWVDLFDVSEKEYNDYIEACKGKGFNIDEKLDTISFEAHNVDGYKLRLEYWNHNSEMQIELEEPIKMNTVSWPDSVAGNKLPVPESTVGNFSYEYDDHFFVYIGNTTKEDYTEYVAACSEMGFNVDYNKGEDYYYADDAEGWHISVCYEGFNIMSIRIDKPAEEEESTSSETTSSEAQSTNDDLGADFKAAMDSYESFMNEYVDFMKRYKANPADLGLLSDYADYMSRYAQFVADFSEWENEELNSVEVAYYLDVQTRVSKKLLEIAE